MSARHRRTARDRRRRTHGQNLLVDGAVVDRLIDRLDLRQDEFVVDVGAGTGALTFPLARAGANVLAIERDRDLVRRLQTRMETDGLAGRIQIRRADLRDVTLPTRPYRVVANPPFGLTTSLLSRLLDDPVSGPSRADLLLQWEVARKRAATPASTLRSAAWAPWWSFELGPRVPREAFRPVPAVDAGWLTIVRREPPLLPNDLALAYRGALEPLWQQRSTSQG